MTKFTFTAVEDDGSITSTTFDSETWVDTFPKYLNLLRGTGFKVDERTAMIAPGISQHGFADRDFLCFEEHSPHYFDFDRNK